MPDPALIGPHDTAFHLELTPAQLKIVHSSLRCLLSDFGHNEPDVRRIVRQVLAKLPEEEALRGIPLA